jgi:hypothetical protein
MTTIQLLKAGIEQANWAHVCDAFEQLTGNAIKPPATPATARAQVAMEEIARIAGEFVGEPVSVSPAPAAVLKEQAVTEDKEPEPQTEDDADDDEDDAHSNVPVSQGATVSGNVYGIEQQVVTQAHVTEKERRANRRFAKNHPRNPRSPHKPIIATCTECKRDYESPVAIPKGVGALCPTCLKSRRR